MAKHKGTKPAAGKKKGGTTKATAYEMPLPGDDIVETKADAPQKVKGKRGRPRKQPKPYPGTSFGLGAAEVRMVPIDDIVLDDNTFQFRLSVKTKEIEDSIRTHGVLVAVTLRPHPSHPGKHQIVSGFHRTIGAKNVGHAEVPSIVRNLTDEEAYIHAYTENENRKSFRDLDRALGISKLRADQGKTTAEIAQLLRLSDRQVQRLEGLLNYDDIIKEALDNGDLETTHALILHQAQKRNEALDLDHWIGRVVDEELTTAGLKLALSDEGPTAKRERGVFYREKEQVLTFNRKFIKDASQAHKAKAVVALRRLIADLEGE